MIKLQKHGILILMLALISILPAASLAQDDGDTAIRVVGSGISLPLVEAFAQNTDADVTLDSEVTGTSSGIVAFCNGEADVVATTRPLTVQDEAVCDDNDIGFFEVLLAYDILAIVAHPDMEFASCVSTTEINLLYPPSAPATIATWQDLIEDAPEALGISLILPPTNSTTTVLLDELVSGAGFRPDAIIAADDAETLETVAATEGSLGVISYASYDPDNSDVMLVEVQNSNIVSCVAPDSEAVSGGTYELAASLLMYVNSASVTDNDALNALLDTITSDASIEIADEQGFTAPDADSRELLAEAIAEGNDGRQFSRNVSAFSIPQDVAGTVQVAGSATAGAFFNSISGAFSQSYGGLTIDANIAGEADGTRRLCNDEVDFTFITNPLSNEVVDNCAAIDVDIIEMPIGTQAVVLVANAEAEYLACLTTEQLVQTWAVVDGETVSNWQEVDPSFDDVEFILFGDRLGSSTASLFLSLAGAGNAPHRADAEEDSNPQYRAAATANVEGALTYMGWNDYERVVENEQQNIQLVSVDGGDGCVEPTIDTIESGEYPLTRTISIGINSQSIERTEVKSVLWFMVQDQQAFDYFTQGFVNVTPNSLLDKREFLQDAFDIADEALQARLIEEAAAAAAEAEAAAAEAGVEETEEATTDGN